MTVDRSRAPAISPPEPGGIDPADGGTDLGSIGEDSWYGRSVVDSIGLSASAARRLAGSGRARAFILDRIEDVRCEVDAGNGRSIVLRDGLYGIEKRR